MNSKIALFFACALLLLTGCSGNSSDKAQSAEKPQAQAVAVQTQTAKIKIVEIWDEYIGRFTAIDNVDLRPRVSGYIEKVHFDDGQTVKEGQLLFSIDARPFKAAYDKADADVKSAETQVALTAVELERSATLLKARAGSQEEYDQSLAAKRAAEASLDAAKATRQEFALDLEFTKVTAPISGRISDARLRQGNFVASGETLLTTIVSVDPIHFSFSGTEQQFLNYLELDREGVRGSSIDTPNPVRIQLANQKDKNLFPIQGRMSFIDNTVDVSTSTIRATALVDNPDGELSPGLFGRLELFEQETEVLIVPDTLIQFDQSRRFVWTIDEESKAKQTTVELGRNLGEGQRQILSGLKDGDEIISGKFFLLRPGMLVKKASSEAASSETPSGQK
ncbi:efflux RND transporter periplasmic adaptor subunit [Hellea sp.]|nr:efflux RND transporter periplasmic adaptor subunit [Hellea sp.]